MGVTGRKRNLPGLRAGLEGCFARLFGPAVAFTLSDYDRAQFSSLFRSPISWDDAKRIGAEDLRWWRTLSDKRSALILAHNGGAVAVLRRSGGMITGLELNEGEAGRRLLGKHGFRPSDAVREEMKREFRPGRPVAEAVSAAFPRGGVVELGTVAGKRRIRLGTRGVLEVRLDRDMVRSHSFVVGADAMELIEAFEADNTWRHPTFEGGHISARTRSEAYLYVAVHGGDVEQSRLLAGTFEVVATIPTGRRLFRFHLDDATEDTAPHELGPGVSSCLDPSDLVLFASRVRADLPESVAEGTALRHAGLLAQASAGLTQAIRFIPQGEELPPLGIYRTRTGEYHRMTHPDLYRRSELESESRLLSALSLQWWVKA